MCNRCKEYNVSRGYTAAMSDDEEEQMDDNAAQEQGSQADDTAGILVEGYTTVFDIRVALTPVELIPVVKAKK